MGLLCIHQLQLGPERGLIGLTSNCPANSSRQLRQTSLFFPNLELSRLKVTSLHALSGSDLERTILHLVEG